jgi:hypothetical protein
MIRRINLLADSTVSVGEAVSFPAGNGAAELRSRAFAREASPAQPESSPDMMPLEQFLFEYRHSFGLPGAISLSSQPCERLVYASRF